MSENGDEGVTITIRVFPDQRIAIDHPPVLLPETVVAMLDRASNFYKMRMTATMVVEILRKAKEDEKLRQMIR
jgi:hypothetical protein